LTQEGLKAMEELEKLEAERGTPGYASMLRQTELLQVAARRW